MNARVRMLCASLAFAACAARAADRIDVRIASGDAQVALAYAASTEPGYLTTFAAPLAVVVTGSHRDDASVRYRCVSPGCRFALSTQPDDVKRVDPRTYDVRVRRARAALRPIVATDSPGPVVVEVRALPREGESRGTVARFALTAR